MSEEMKTLKKILKIKEIRMPAHANLHNIVKINIKGPASTYGSNAPGLTAVYSGLVHLS